MRTRWTFVCIVIALLLAGCGQKGDLVRPDPKAPAPATQ